MFNWQRSSRHDVVIPEAAADTMLLCSCSCLLALLCMSQLAPFADTFSEWWNDFGYLGFHMLQVLTPCIQQPQVQLVNKTHSSSRATLQQLTLLQLCSVWGRPLCVVLLLRLRL